MALCTAAQVSNKYTYIHMYSYLITLITRSVDVQKLSTDQIGHLGSRHFPRIPVLHDKLKPVKPHSAVPAEQLRSSVETSTIQAPYSEGGEEGKKVHR